ncbi:hypothetical protein OAL15_04020 [Flavobacteriales bacterium]|nr:hypothetical protein [Flavobacteriales bacterium]
MTIHKEGYRMLTLLALLAICGTLTVIYFFPHLYWLHLVVGIGGGILFLIVLQFFRSPKRESNGFQRQTQCLFI